MNKKLMAAAVAGALTLPAGAAMAQTSTVQMYGLFNVEYAPYVKQPDGLVGGVQTSRTTNDQLNSGASRIGFRGQEKLGAGLTVWFQCETDVEFLDGGTDNEGEVYDTNTQTTWCGRNSALGLRGGWGNFYVGTWDSPAKRVTSATRMLAETGWLGVQRHLMTLAGWGYSHRVTKSINYDSPRLGGFSFALQTTTNNADRNQFDPAVAPSNSGTDGRIWGANAMYAAGPLTAGLAYQRYENNIQFAAPPFPAIGAIDGTEDTVWVFGINYTFGNFKVGFVATDIEAERQPGGPATAILDSERRSYSTALEWNLGGPHSVLFGWTHAGNTEGTGASPVTSGSANIYQAQYQYRFSKRTMGGVGFITVDNGDGGIHTLQGLASAAPGERASAFALQLQHTF